MASIRQQINIDAGLRDVWRAISTVDGWTSWYADDARVDPRKGGRITLSAIGDDGEPVDEVGIFLTFRPTRKLEVAWDSNSPAQTKGTTISFQVARDGNETRLHSSTPVAVSWKMRRPARPSSRSGARLFSPCGTSSSPSSCRTVDPPATPG